MDMNVTDTTSEKNSAQPLETPQNMNDFAVRFESRPFLLQSC